MDGRPDSYKPHAALHRNLEHVVDSPSLGEVVDDCVRAVMEGDSPTEAAATMLELAKTADKLSLVLPGYEDTESSIHFVGSTAVHMLRSHLDKVDPASPRFAPALHLLADAEAVARKSSEVKQSWLQLHRVGVQQPDGSIAEVEFVGTPPESAVVPFTTDGKIILVQRLSPALGRDILTVLTRASIDRLNPDLVALQAIHKLDLPGSEQILPIRVAKTSQWKYLDSEEHHYWFDVPLSAAEALRRARIEDSRVQDVVALTPQEFFRAVSTGAVDSLCTINTVQLALAKRDHWFGFPDNELQPNPDIVHKLKEDVGIVRHETLEVEAVPYFSRRKVQDDIVILAESNQSQAFPIIYQDGVPHSVVMYIEPFLAQGKRSLALASGGIDKYDGLTTAIRELREETGYTANGQRQLVRPAFVMPLYMDVQSEVWELVITGKGTRAGGDELEPELGEAVIVPIRDVGKYIDAGLITDASTVAAILNYTRQTQLRPAA